MANPGGAPPVGSTGEETLPLSHALWLFALFFAVSFLFLEPLIGFSVFGSDTGEYFRLSRAIAATGHLPGSYGGWGSAYPDFPGTFLLVAVVAGATGSDVLSALSITVPVMAAFSVLPLFLLFRRLFPSDSLAILGAAFASVAFPRAFSIAHPAPLALGDVLVVAGLWMFVEGRQDLRWYLPLTATAAALVITHHLSSYFFLVSSLGGLVAYELWRPGGWSRRFPLRELLFSGGFLVALLAYWFEYAKHFLPTVAGGSIAGGVGAVLAFEASVVAAVAGLGYLIHRRRERASPRAAVRFPTDRSVLRDLVLILVGMFAGALLLVTVPLPGTGQTTTPGAVAFFAPMLAIVCLAAGTRRLVTASRLGPFLLTWLGVVGVSALVVIASGNPTLSPGRHAEYLVLPLALLVAIGVGRLVARAGDRGGRRAVLAGASAVTLLLVANAAIIYPPPADFGGFQEGLTVGDAALWGWVGLGLPPAAVVASDHRLSSMIFGFDGNRATWDSTPGLFTGTNHSRALEELRLSLAPHSLKPVDAVAVDATMVGGVALDPGQLAKPLSASSIAWLAAPPFVPVYENGAETVYWVAGPVGGT